MVSLEEAPVGEERGLSLPDLRTTYEEGASDSLLSFVVGMQAYFGSLGYALSSSFQGDFLSFLGRMEAEELFSFSSFEELEPLAEPFIAGSPAEHESFHGDYLRYVSNRQPVLVVGRDKKKRAKNLFAMQKEAQEEMERIREGLLGAQRKLSLLEKKERDREGELLEERSIALCEKKLGKVKRELSLLNRGLPHEREIRDLLSIARGEAPLPGEKDLLEMRAELKGLLGKAALSKKYQELFDAISAQAGLIDKLVKARREAASGALHKAEEERNRAEREYQKAEERLKKLEGEVTSFIASARGDALVVKDSSRVHRGPEADFSQGKAVQVMEDNPAFARPFSSLLPAEKEMIREYILENARSFRTRMSRNLRSTFHQRLDIPSTCKEACRTGGIPLKLSYTKPARSKAKLTMVLDISGSCKGASEMMLTTMHEMREVFPGGLDTYVFVNHLYDVTNIFRESQNAEESVKGILEAVETKGVYSDYFRPLQSLATEQISRITRDSIVIFIGDARNNRNQSGEEFIRKVCRKAKHSYWLNTEERSLWDTADSIISLYAPYMDQVREVVNVGELLAFLQEVR